MSQSNDNAYVETTSDVCGGKPRIKGHRIRVQDIAVWHEYQGLTADEIVARHPQLTLAEVHGALSYYYEHAQQIRIAIREDQEFADQLKSQTPSKLVLKLSGMPTDGTALSS
ncbi:MAG: DUF433 domain-containing protein [Planctomycetes bacterium]|nr:DUF433 domain-containing protein [Planctomycetota bacterium]